MKTRRNQDLLSVLPSPLQPKGKISIAGKEYKIGPQAVPSSPGISENQIIDKLRQASKKSLFGIPASLING